MADPAIAVQGLRKSYGRHEAVMGIDSSARTVRGRRPPRPSSQSAPVAVSWVRFRLPAGVTVEARRGACDVEPEVSGTEITLKTDHPQATLYKLTGWAEHEHIELEGIEVSRPSLDDVFLELTADTGDPAADATDATDSGSS
jgi:hypothetical protein